MRVPETHAEKLHISLKFTVHMVICHNVLCSTQGTSRFCLGRQAHCWQAHISRTHCGGNVCSLSCEVQRRTTQHSNCCTPMHCSSLCCSASPQHPGDTQVICNLSSLLPSEPKLGGAELGRAGQRAAQGAKDIAGAGKRADTNTVHTHLMPSFRISGAGRSSIINCRALSRAEGMRHCNSPATRVGKASLSESTRPSHTLGRASAASFRLPSPVTSC